MKKISLLLTFFCVFCVIITYVSIVFTNFRTYNSGHNNKLMSKLLMEKKILQLQDIRDTRYIRILIKVVVLLLLACPASGNNLIAKFGFWPEIDPAVYQPDWNGLTHVAYTHWTVNPDGSLNDPASISRYYTVRDEAHQHNVKMDIVIFSGDSSVLDSVLANHRQDLVNNITNALISSGADGINLDLEYPLSTNSITGTSNTPLFEDFIKRLNTSLKTINPNYHISNTVNSAVEDVYRNANLSQYLDSVFLMGYDYQVWYNNNGDAGPGSPINDPTRYDVNDTIRIMEKYYPASKIVYGIPFYAYDYQVTSNAIGAHRINGGAFTVLSMADAISGSQKYGRYWDPNSSTPWYKYKANGVWHQVWYLDDQATQIRYDYAKSAELQGIGFFALGYDYKYPSIWKIFNDSVNALPIANFSCNVTRGITPLYVQFTDQSKYATGWKWNFGDGTNSTDQSPMHIYSKAGEYTVNLTVTNEIGTNSKTVEITVNETSIGEKVYPVADFTAYPTYGNAPLSVQFTDFSQNATSRSWDFNSDGIEESIDINPVYIYNFSGEYTVNLTVSNANETANKIAKINVLDESSSGDGIRDGNSGRSDDISSDGSKNIGIGSSLEPQSNVEAKELSQAFIGSGNSVNFAFPQNVTPVMKISFDSKKTAGKTKIIVETLKGQSTLVSEPPSEVVYKFLNIWVGNSGFATPENIENAVICFKVKKSWMQDKDINKSSILLSGYSDNKWKQLQTRQSEEDDVYLYYTSQTFGFSSFAIVGNTKVGGSLSDSNSKPNTQGIKQKSTEANVEHTFEQEKLSTPDLGIIYGIIGILVAFLFRNEKG